MVDGVGIGVCMCLCMCVPVCVCLCTDILVHHWMQCKVVLMRIV